jgi:hypothetical protein
MWSLDQIAIDLLQVEGPVMIVKVITPVGAIEVIGGVHRVGRVLHVVGAHVQGLSPGVLGRAGLNAIGRKLLKEADVDKVIIEGGTRTTGARCGKRPPLFRFPNH